MTGEAGMRPVKHNIPPSRPRAFLKGALLAAVVFGAVLGYLAWRHFLVPDTRMVMMPVDWSHVADGYTVVKSSEKRLEVRVQGPRTALKRLEAAAPVFYPELPDTRPGVNTLAVRAQDLSLGGQIKALSVLPQTLTFTAKPLAEKTLPVIVRTTGEPAPDYTVTELWVEPDSVTVQGPAGVVDALETAPTAPVDVTGASGELQKWVPLALPEGVQAVSWPDPVQVTVGAARRQVVQWVRRVPVFGRGAAHGFHIRPPAIDLKAQGSIQALEGLRTSPDLSVTVDLSGLEPGVYVRRASISLPLSVTLLEAAPEVFTVTIQ